MTYIDPFVHIMGVYKLGHDRVNICGEFWPELLLQ